MFAAQQVLLLPLHGALTQSRAQLLMAFLARRRQFAAMLTTEKDRLQTARPAVRPNIQRHIRGSERA